MPTPAANRYMASRPVVLGLARVSFLALCHLPFISAAPASYSPSSPFIVISESTSKPAGDPGLWLYLGIAAALVLSGGAFAGLTIALMGQDEVYLQVIQTSGEDAERKNAASVLSLLKKGKHWVLVTLLLSNVITNETLPIVLDRSLGGGWPAVLGSTILIVIFGEIVPQSICVRYGLPIGAWLAPAVLALMYLLSPIAWPVAKLLDQLLGEDHGTIYKKAGLKTLVTLHKTLGEAGEQLNSDEVTIISAVLDLKEKAVGRIMTPMDDVFTMSVDTVLDEQTMDVILSQGYSRIPIHAPDNPLNFVGMLLVKMLITYDPDDGKRVRDFALATLPETRPETSCLDIVNFFQEGKSHMVLVSEYPSEDRGALGVVTLEDVIEELIGEEIIDESDVFVDVHKAIRRMTPAPKSRVPKGRIIEEPPALDSVPEDQLVDVDGDTRNQTPQGSRLSETRRRRSSVEAPPPRFQLRRYDTDGNSDWKGGLVTQRGTTDEIREQLKHLGPSNLASRPRQTRYQNVKIKPGSLSPSRSALTDIDSTYTAPDVSSRSSLGLAGGIGTGLLQSGGMDARDGVHALKLGYGTMTPVDRSDDTISRPHKENAQISVPEPVNEEQDDQGNQRPSSNQRPQSKQKPDRGSPAASVRSGSSHSLKPGNYKHPGPARSGSITEQVVDVNGVRKVVLHTTSSSDNDEQPSSSPPKPQQPKAEPPKPKVPYQQSIKPEDSGDDSNKPSVSGGTSNNATKKRRRKKKRGGQGSKNSDNPNEQQPLLS